jgi:hypothetical protein
MDLQENYENQETHPTTSLEENDTFVAQESEEKPPKNAFLFNEEHRLAGVAARAAKVELWKTLDTRQDFVDERYMRGVIRAAGLNAPARAEPATAKRLKTLLRRVGIQRLETLDAVGTSVEGYLKLNPNLPLWAALSAVLEGTGKYDKKAAEIAEEEGDIYG